MPCLNLFKAFFISLCLLTINVGAQNTLEKELNAENIKTISINGDQIFTIKVTTTKTETIKIHSVVDGEYGDIFQVETNQKDDLLKLYLKQLPLTSISDDKRNAHKVIAASLFLEIPNNLNLSITSDVGSVDLIGTFKSLIIQLNQGYCNISGNSKNARVNTIDGNINVVTNNAKVNAISSKGKVKVDQFLDANCVWVLQSINGDITVTKND